MYKKYYDITVRGVKARSGAKLFEVRADDMIGYIDAIDYSVSPTEALGALARQGLFFIGSKRASLVEMIAAVEDFEEAALFDRVGHNGDYFVLPTGEVLTPPGAEAGDITFEPRPEKGHQQGSLEDWLALVAGPLANHRICEFFMMMPFAGPLRGYTQRVQNFGWELIGVAGSGKSVLLQLMASTCGGSLGGDEGCFALSFAATAAGLETEMRYYSDLIMIIDEGNLFELNQSKSGRGRSFSQLLMALGKGQEKLRYKTSSRTFRFVYVTSSNETLLEVIGGTSSSAVVDAVADRLMTIKLPDREQGIFDELPEGCGDIGDFIGELVEASARNHGVAMPHYIRGMLSMAYEDRQPLGARIEDCISEFRRQTGVASNAGSARRVADCFGLIYAAGRLAVHLGALPATYDPLASTLACYRLYRASVRSQLSAVERVLELIDDPDVIDLDRSLPELSDDEFNTTKAFRQTNSRKQTELLVPPPSMRRIIPNWNVARRDDFEFSRMIVRDSEHWTVKRRVRVNRRKDRVICIVIDDQPARKRELRANPVRRRRSRRRRDRTGRR